MRRLFLCYFAFAREGFSPDRVAQLGHGGFLMLEYQKSSAAAPKPRNWFGVGILLVPSMRNLPTASAHSEPRNKKATIRA